MSTKLQRRLKPLVAYAGRVSRAPTWQLLVALLLLIFISATLLRLNNIGMIERRAAVAEADKNGDKAKIASRLLDLQRYVSSHMNSSLDSGLYLETSYSRDRDRALASASSASNPNSEIYKQASLECRSRFVGGVASFRNDYVQCVVQKVGVLSPGQDPASSLKLPRADLYRYNFVSPAWTPDAAGLSVLITLLLAFWIAGRWLRSGLVWLLVKRRFMRIYS